MNRDWPTSEQWYPMPKDELYGHRIPLCPSCERPQNLDPDDGSCLVCAWLPPEGEAA